MCCKLGYLENTPARWNNIFTQSCDSAAFKGYGSRSSSGSNCTESPTRKKWHGSSNNKYRGAQAHDNNPVLS